MSFEIASDYLINSLKPLLARKILLDSEAAAGSTSSHKNEREELGRQIEELNLACKILSSGYSGLKSFVENIKPVIVKIHTGKELTPEERSRIVQFYLEVSTTIYL